MDRNSIAKIYNVDVLQAILWRIESWNAFPPSVFMNCWRKTGLLDYYTCEYAEPDAEDDVMSELSDMLSRLHPSDPVSVEELLNPPGENILADDPTDEDFCRVGSPCGDNRCGDEGDVCSLDDEDDSACFIDPTPENMAEEELGERLRWMAQLFVSANAMGVRSRDIIGLRSMQMYREELERKRGRKQQKYTLYFLEPKELF